MRNSRRTSRIALVTLGLIATISLIALISIYADAFPTWTGLGSFSPQAVPEGYERSKTLWDWMELLLIPLGLAFVAFFLNRVEKQREQDQAQETTLQSYLDNMTSLLLERGLLISKPRDEIRTIARARTLTALHVLDPKRKGVVIQFLAEAHLITSREPIVELKDADLTRVDLRNMRLKGINLSEAFMNYANLSHSDMRGSNLTKTRLNSANMTHIFMKWATLQGAELINAKLRSAYLRLANLSNATFIGANLHEAVLHQANMKGANLTKSNLTKASFLDVDTSSLIGVTSAQLSRAVEIGKRTPKLNFKRHPEDRDDEVDPGA